MKIEIVDDKILLDNESGDAPCILMQKPEIDDYSNITVRPLVVSYHLTKETIWDRICLLMKELQSVCGETPYLACYTLLFAEIYPTLLANSQAKNIICYGMSGESKVSDIFQNLMTFLQEKSSFISLPVKPFVFSALLNKSCQAAVVSLDECMDLQTICDAISKIRNGGCLLLYTIKGDAPEELAVLTRPAQKRTFGSCTVYSITVDAAVSAFAYENNSESVIVPSVNTLFNMFEELRNLTSAMEDRAKCPLEAYPYAVELLDRMENVFLDMYDVLENPELPILANTLKEALMDCYIGLSNRFDVESYFNRMQREMRAFYEVMEREM